MKKTLFISVLALGGMLITNSCGDKYLDRQPQGQFSPTVIATSDGVERYLIGAYALLDGIGTNNLTQWHGAVSNWVFGGISSDDAYKGTDAGDQPEQTFIERYDWQTANGHILGKWRHLYDAISRTNDLLNNVKLVTTGLSDLRKKEIQAEARFLRAHYHFEAKKMWNNIPYINDSTYKVTDPSSVKIGNTKDIWPLIEADLQFAINNLPADNSKPKGDVGRISRLGAVAYLAKVKMYQAFPKGQPNAQKLQEAKVLLEEVVKSGKYKLVDKYSDNFDVPTRNNAESIFEVQYSVTAAADGPGNQGDGLAFPYTGPWSCCGFYQPSHNLVNAFKTGADGLPLFDTFNNGDVHDNVTGNLLYTGNLDPRLDKTVGRPGVLYRDYKIHGTDFVRDLNYAGPYSPIKHVPSKPFIGVSGWQNLTANNYRILRYDMVLLWLAECEVEVGSLDAALALVNQVRKRAANPDDFVKAAKQGAKRDEFTVLAGNAASYVINQYPAGHPAFASKDAARQAVRFETRLETAMEGHRFFDLVRWGIAEPVLTAYLSGEKSKRTYLDGASFTEKNNYYPIPQQAIVLTGTDASGKNILTQNPGY
jgi:starch-binding outer membrane protein, SusD/RagB family